MQNEVKTLLKQKGFSATKSRLAVLNMLLKIQPANPNQLISALPGVDRATVYRTIDLFVKLGVAKKIYSGFKYAIEIGDAFQEHHHHLTCLRCGTVIDLHSQNLEYAIEQASLNSNFRQIRHDLEIAGYCTHCS